MIGDHFLPIAKKIRDNALVVEEQEKQLHISKMHTTQNDEDSDVEADVQLVCGQFLKKCVPHKL